MGIFGEVAIGVAVVPQLAGKRRSRRADRASPRTSADGDVEAPAVIENDFGSPRTDDGSDRERGGAPFQHSPTYMSFVNARRGRRRKHHDDAASEPVNRWAPVFAGLCCPFSILLEIPGLTEHWYIRTTAAGGGGKIIDTQPNPPILDIGLGVSIAFAVLANVSLITRFLEKKPRLSTLLTIFSLTCHDILNIIIVTIFGVVHRADDGYTYAQSFWMTVASSVVSSACNITLITDFVRVDDFKHKGSGLTQKQRSLVIACMALLCYLALGSLVFSFIDSPHLDFQDALYFTICTVSTVGFGDIVPNTTAAKIFLFPYDIGGIILLTVTIVMARESILESFKDSYRRRRERMLEKARERRQQRKLAHEAHNHDAAAHGAANGGILHAPQRAAHWISTHTPAPEQRPHPLAKVKSAVGKGLVKLCLKKGPEELDRLPRTATEMSTSQESAFIKFTDELKEDERKEFLNRLSIASVLFLGFWLVGSAVFSVTEGWSYFEGLYFSYVFFVSLGYGDFSPKSPAGRGFFIAWALFGIAVMTVLLSVLTEGWQTNYKKAVTAQPGQSRKRLMRTLTRTRTMDTTVSGTSAGDPTDPDQSEKGDKAASPPSPLPPSLPSSPVTASPVMANPPEPSWNHDEADKPVKDMAHNLMEAAKGFSQHASYWMNRKKGEPPGMLIHLLEQTQEFEDPEYAAELRRLAENAAEGDTQKMLFLISYTRSLEHLLETAQEPLALLRAREAEVASLRRLTGEMEGVLRDIRSHPACDGDQLTLSPSFASDRSPTPTTDSPTVLLRSPVARHRTPSLLSKRAPSFLAAKQADDTEAGEVSEKADTEDDRGEGASTAQPDALGLYHSAVETLKSYPDSHDGPHGHHGKRKKMMGFGTAAHLVKWLHHDHSDRDSPSRSTRGSGTATPMEECSPSIGSTADPSPPGSKDFPRTLTFQEPKKP